MKALFAFGNFAAWMWGATAIVDAIAATPLIVLLPLAGFIFITAFIMGALPLARLVRSNF